MSADFFVPRGFRDPVSGELIYLLNSGSPYLTGHESAQLLNNTAEWLDNTDHYANSFRLYKSARASRMGTTLLGRLSCVALGIHSTDAALIESSIENTVPGTPFEARIGGGVISYYFKRYGVEDQLPPWSEKGSTPMKAISSVIENFPLPIHSISGYGLLSYVVSLDVKGILDNATDLEQLDKLLQHPHLTPTGIDPLGMRFTINYPIGDETLEYKMALQLEPSRPRDVI